MAFRIASRQPRQKPKKAIRDKKYLAFVHELPCLVTGASEVEAHHLISARGGWGRRGDNWVVPLSPDMHRELHEGDYKNGLPAGEENFMDRYGLPLFDIAAFIWKNKYKHEVCVRYINERNWLIEECSCYGCTTQRHPCKFDGTVEKVT